MFDNNNSDELIYNNSVNIRRGMHTDLVINRFGKVFTDEQRMDNCYDDTWSDNDWNNNGWNNDNNINGWGNDYRDNNYGTVMRYGHFQQLKQSVQRESFDKNKMDILCSIFSYNRVNAQQVRELAQLISFEQTRLELVKFACRYTSYRGTIL